jgi:acyl-CoA synthetase (AMP-forming)/AMP-acid ligase II
MLRSISFLLYDHIGGVNTMLYTFANGGCLVTVERRDPDSVLAAVEKHRVELLPTSPTFINLMLLSEAHKRHDLRSLRVISYGTEPMPEHTLRRLHELFPDIALQQTYGLSELGILQSKSREPDSLWVKIGGHGYETRVVDGVLHVKARSSMLGYLNAPSPFTEDGWFNTNDVVEVDGEYMRILGRHSDIINVGGEKVYPAEVENVIQELDEVAEVTVYGEKHAITGNIVCADVSTVSPLDSTKEKELIARVKQHCREKLQRFKVPLRVNIVPEQQHTERFKKSRR